MTPTPPVRRCSCHECQTQSDGAVVRLHQNINFLMTQLDEKQRRLFVAVEAQRLGHGGIKKMAEITGMNVNTISRGMTELDSQNVPKGVRKPGGGRPPFEKKTPGA